MSDNVILVKSYEFAKKIVILCHRLQAKKKEYNLTKQLVRSGTSIGANVEEATGGFSKKDFRYKMSIAHKEARESRYWMRLLRDTGIAKKEDADALLEDAEELIKILFTIVKNSSDG